MVTLYHWDLPQALEDKGGWLNEDSVEYFNDYANFCFKEFGKKVKLWVTHNEPFITSYYGYGLGIMAPGKHGPGTNTYIVGHNLLLSHARAVRTYKRKHQPSQQGKIGITLNSDWREPMDEFEPSDWSASERIMQWTFGWFANPIFGSGDYPDVMKEKVQNKSLAQGYKTSRLPEFTEREKQELKGSADFFGLNHYTSSMCTEEIQPVDDADFGYDSDVMCEQDPKWKGSGSVWLKVVPWGLRKNLNWIKSHYGDIPIYITENGVSDDTGELDDNNRVDYLRAYTNEVLKAIDLDRVNVKGYTAWSLMDNFEWISGYSEKFGLYHVNFTDPDRPRTPKASAAFYRNLITDNGFKEEGLISQIPNKHEFLNGQFPPNCATSAYQIEGGVTHGELTNSSSPSTITSTYHSTELFTSQVIRSYNENSGSFPLAASIAIPIAVVVVILIITGIVCGIRRRALSNAHVSNEGHSVRMQDVTNQVVEIDTDSAGHYEGLGEQTHQEHVYEKANQRTFTSGSQNTYVNC